MYINHVYCENIQYRDIIVHRFSIYRQDCQEKRDMLGFQYNILAYFLKISRQIHVVYDNFI